MPRHAIPPDLLRGIVLGHYKRRRINIPSIREVVSIITGLITSACSWLLTPFLLRREDDDNVLHQDQHHNTPQAIHDLHHDVLHAIQDLFRDIQRVGTLLERRHASTNTAPPS